MNENGRALGLLLAVVTAIAAVEAVVLVRLERRVADLEDRTVSAGEEMTPLALGDEVWEMREKVGDMEERVQVLSKAQAALRRDVDRRMGDVERLAAEPATVPASPGIELDADARASLEKAVARMVDEKLAERPKGQGGEWKPTLEQFKDRLKLTEEQTERAERIFDDAKHEVFQLASLKRADGTAKIDDIVSAMKSADPEAAMKKVFVGLFTEKIPGREDTYISEILRIKQRASQALDGVLDDGQRKRLSRMNLDHLGVHTSYDPFGEYLQEALQQR